MAADWGLYSALRYKDDWQTKRADARMNLAARQQHRLDLEKDVEQRQAYEQKIAEMFDMFASMDVLPEDQEKVKAVERDARRKIYDGINKYNGDLKRFMSAGGVTALSEYKSSVLQSQDLKNAMMNKMNLGLYLDATKNGKFVKPIQMETVEVDPETGEEKTVIKNVSFEDQFRLFKEGKLNQLQFGGAEDVVDINAEDFWKAMKNPNDPYSADNIVTASQIYEKAIFKKASHEQALQLAQRYSDMLNNGGQVWRWGSKDKYELALKLQAMQQDWVKLGLSQKQIEMEQMKWEAEQQANQIGNQWATQFDHMSDGEEMVIEPDMIKNGMIPSMVNLQPATDEADGNVPSGKKYKLHLNGKYYFQDGTEVDGTTVQNVYALDMPRKYLKINGRVTVGIPVVADDDADVPGIATSTLGRDYLTEEGQSRGFSYNGGATAGLYSGMIWMDIDDYRNSQSTVMGINKQRNLVGSKHEYTSPSIGNRQQQQIMGNTMNQSGMGSDQYIQGAIGANQR